MFVHAETVAVTGWLLILRHAVRAIEEVKFLTTFAALAMVVAWVNRCAEATII